MWSESVAGQLAGRASLKPRRLRCPSRSARPSGPAGAGAPRNRPALGQPGIPGWAPTLVATADLCTARSPPSGPGTGEPAPALPSQTYGRRRVRQSPSPSSQFRGAMHCGWMALDHDGRRRAEDADCRSRGLRTDGGGRGVCIPPGGADLAASRAKFASADDSELLNGPDSERSDPAGNEAPEPRRLRPYLPCSDDCVWGYDGAEAPSPRQGVK